MDADVIVVGPASPDWRGSAGFDRDVHDPAGEDYWGHRWAQAYVDFASGEKRSWLHGLGLRWVPLVGWAERGGYLADGHGNSVPRFHLTCGTGPGVIAPFEQAVRNAHDAGLVTFAFRHRVDHLEKSGGAVDGVSGVVLAPDTAPRGAATNREETGTFEFKAPAVLVTAGGIDGNQDLVRANWPERLGQVPRKMIIGVPEYVDGRMLGFAEAAGGRIVNRDRMWHYTEGVTNWDPIWPDHGIRIIPGPSSLWFDARGQRLSGAAGPVEAFKMHGEDFVVASSLGELVDRMNALTDEPLIDLADLERQIVARDREMDNPFTKDLQVSTIHNSRRSRGERVACTATGRWKAHSWAAACSPGARRAGVLRRSCGDRHQIFWSRDLQTSQELTCHRQCHPCRGPDQSGTPVSLRTTGKLPQRLPHRSWGNRRPRALLAQVAAAEPKAPELAVLHELELPARSAEE